MIAKAPETMLTPYEGYGVAGLPIAAERPPGARLVRAGSADMGGPPERD